MKKIILSIAIAVLGFTANAQDNNVGIGTVTPDASAKLDVASDSKGFLPPRLTTAQRDLIANPATGLMIFNSTESCLQMNTGTPAIPDWFCLISTAELNKDSDGDGIIDILDPAPNSVGEVTSATGKVWMDRNLGSPKVATSFDDTDASGDKYQWGRARDGHEDIESETTTVTATSSDPGHSKFIMNDDAADYNWTDYADEDNLWQGVNGINNPCPSGFRVPTIAEWSNEISAENINNTADAFNSSLKLPTTGYRHGSNGLLYDTTTRGLYWASDVAQVYSENVSFNATDVPLNPYRRNFGFAVRCVKD